MERRPEHDVVVAMPLRRARRPAARAAARRTLERYLSAALPGIADAPASAPGPPLRRGGGTGPTDAFPPLLLKTLHELLEVAERADRRAELLSRCAGNPKPVPDATQMELMDLRCAALRIRFAVNQVMRDCGLVGLDVVAGVEP